MAGISTRKFFGRNVLINAENDVAEGNLAGQRVAVVHDRLACGAIPAVNLDAATPTLQHADVGLDGRRALDLRMDGRISNQDRWRERWRLVT